MTKEKFNSLTKYLSSLTDKLNSGIPSKHTHRPSQYQVFIINEINIVKRKLDNAKFEGIK